MRYDAVYEVPTDERGMLAWRVFGSWRPQPPLGPHGESGTPAFMVRMRELWSSGDARPYREVPYADALAHEGMPRKEATKWAALTLDAANSVYGPGAVL